MNSAPDSARPSSNGEPLEPDTPVELSISTAESALPEESGLFDDDEAVDSASETELDPELIPLRNRLLAARDYLASRAIIAGQEEQREDEIIEIEEALRRIAEGAYGVCEYSGEPIPRERLAIEPWTRFTRESQGKLASDGRRLLQISLPADFAAGLPPR